MKWLHGLGLSLLAVFAPAKAMILIALLLILVDLVTGLLAAKKRGEWTKLSEIKSAGLRRTLSKICVYETAIMLGFLVEHYMIDGFLPVAKIAAGLVSIVELKSVLENLDELNSQPIFKSLIQKLGSVNDEKPKDE